MPVLHAGAIETWYEDSGGTGPPVVLIHAHSLDLRMWPAQLFALRDAGYRVIRYDLRGHGRSSTPAAGYTWAHHVDDLLSLLDALDVERAHLIGHSAGGGVALQAALDYPERALSLVLLDPAVPGFGYSEPFAVRMEQLVEVVRAEGWRPAAERLWLTGPMFEGLRRHPAAFDVVRNIALDFPAREYLADDQEPEGPEAVDRLREVRAPTLVIAGEEDPEDFRTAAALVAVGVPRARLVTVPGAGHMTPLERPEAVNELLLNFLADPEGGVAPPPPPVTTRAAVTADLPALAALDGSYTTTRELSLERRGAAPALTFDFTVSHADEDEREENGRGPEYWSARLESGGPVVVAVRDGRVVGAVALEGGVAPGSAALADLRVDAGARLAGVGRALLTAAAQSTRSYGMRSLRADVPSDNVDAVVFLLKSGFRFSGFDDRYLPPASSGTEHVTLFFTLALDGE